MRTRWTAGLLAIALAACAAGDATLDGLWYSDDGQTVVIADGELRLDSGEVIASIEPLGEDALRYQPAGGDTPLTLQVAFPTPLRMTWTQLDGTPFRELTRVAGPE